MTQEPSGLVQGAKDLAYKVENALNFIPTPTKKPDTAWHDQMVKKANDSFKTVAEKRKVGGAEGKTGAAQKKAVAKKTVKRVAGKK